MQLLAVTTWIWTPLLKDHGISKRVLLTAFYEAVSFTREDLVDLNILRTFIHLYLTKDCVFIELTVQNNPCLCESGSWYGLSVLPETSVSPFVFILTASCLSTESFKQQVGCGAARIHLKRNFVVFKVCGYFQLTLFIWLHLRDMAYFLLHSDRYSNHLFLSDFYYFTFYKLFK